MKTYLCKQFHSNTLNHSLTCLICHGLVEVAVTIAHRLALLKVLQWILCIFLQNDTLVCHFNLKKMHTDNCINFNSHHPRILTGVIKCLANRQTKSVTANSKKQQELEYLELGIVCQWDSKLHSDKVPASQITLHTLDGSRG